MEVCDPVDDVVMEGTKEGEALFVVRLEVELEDETDAVVVAGRRSVLAAETVLELDTEGNVDDVLILDNIVLATLVATSAVVDVDNVVITWLLVEEDTAA